jgi:hypothetical protein
MQSLRNSSQIPNGKKIPAMELDGRAHRAQRRMPSWRARRPTAPGSGTCPSPGCAERAVRKRATGGRAQTSSRQARTLGRAAGWRPRSLEEGQREGVAPHGQWNGGGKEAGEGCGDGLKGGVWGLGFDYIYVGFMGRPG